MKARVFISYSTKDRAFADLMLNYIENELKIPCWIAYRDLIGGMNYAEGIEMAIKDVDCILLLYSENSNESEHVKNELELAVSNNKIVIPCKLDSFAPSGQFNYYLKNKHWLELDKFSQVEDQKQIVRNSLINILGSNYYKKCHQLNELLGKIAREGADNYLQDFIYLFYDIITNTYEGRQNLELVAFYNKICDEITMLQQADSPDFTNLIALMNKLWAYIREQLIE